MRHITAFLLLPILLAYPIASLGDIDKTVAVIGTGDMGDSLGPKLAEIGYTVVYGSRDPSRDSVKELVMNTGPNASATTQQEAAQSASIVLLAVGWPAMHSMLPGALRCSKLTAMECMTAQPKLRARHL